MKKLSSLIAMITFCGLNAAIGQYWEFNGTHLYNLNAGNVGISNGALWAPTQKLHVNTLGVGTASIMAESSYTGTTMKALGYFRIKNTATGDMFNMALRKNGAVHEMLQSCYDASAGVWREYAYYNYGTRKYEMRNGVMDVEFKNSGNILFTNSGRVGIGTTTPQSSALVDITSTSKGFLPPRMTSSQRAAISSPAAGLLVFQTDASSGYYYYTGTAWTALGGSSGLTHYIGELFGGGIVVAVWKEAGVEKGLIASLKDIGTVEAWSNVTSTLIGTTAQSLIDGLANSNAIVAQPGHNTSAAQLCLDYINVDYGTGVYSDWYMPALWELVPCFNAAFIVNTVIANNNFTPSNGFVFDHYWSSTESGDQFANGWQFLSDALGGGWKSEMFKVRAVRRF